MSNLMNGMRVVRGISHSLSVLLLTSSTLFVQNLSAQNQDHRVRNVVLVHGAWADGSGWQGVYDIVVKMATTSASSKNRRRLLKKMWLPQSGPLLNRTDRAFLSLIVMGEP